LGWHEEAVSMRLDQGKTWREIAIALQPYFPGKDLHQIQDTVRRDVRRSDRYKAVMLTHPNDKPEPGASTEWKDGKLISDKLIEICETDEITPEFLLRAHNLKPEDWQVVSYRNNYWHSQIKGGKRLVMYQSRLTVKPKVDGISLAEIDKHFAQMDRKYRKPEVIVPKRDARMMAEVNIADLHLGKLCWHGDTPENFDHKIARDMYYRIIAEIIEDLRHLPLEYITFVWANDFFNSDTIDRTTTAGTPQDTDVRWQKMFNIGCEMLVGGIDMLSKMGTDKPAVQVKTFYTPSNHDEVNGYHALQYLAAWFRQDQNIEINTDAYPRKYQLYGNTLLGYGHGDKEGGGGTKDKASRLAAMMPIEAAAMWAQARYREFHVAHLHSEHLIQEINGVAVRRISSPTAADTWHTASGYLGAVRKAQTFVYDRERGLKTIINTPVA